MHIESRVRSYAKKVGLHEESNDLEKRFSPRCSTYWFTTTLRRNGLPREYVKELRGDSRNETMDIYYHIDRKELRESYLSCVVKLGV